MTWGEKYVLRRRIKAAGLCVLIVGLFLRIFGYPLPAWICMGVTFAIIGWALHDENEDRNNPTGTA